MILQICMTPHKKLSLCKREEEGGEWSHMEATECGLGSGGLHNWPQEQVESLNMDGTYGCEESFIPLSCKVTFEAFADTPNSV